MTDIITFDMFKAFETDLHRKCSHVIWVVCENDCGENGCACEDGYGEDSIGAEEFIEGLINKFKTATIRPVENKSYIAEVLVHIECNDPTAYREKEEFHYGIFADGKVGYHHLDVPLSKEEIHEHYDKWGVTIMFWAKDVKRHYSRAQRKARWSPVHEELAAKMWHPDRLTALLERGGWDAVEGV